MGRGPVPTAQNSATDVAARSGIALFVDGLVTKVAIGRMRATPVERGCVAVRWHRLGPRERQSTCRRVSCQYWVSAFHIKRLDEE
jgi:hypothetical protein